MRRMPIYESIRHSSMDYLCLGDSNVQIGVTGYIRSFMGRAKCVQQDNKADIHKPVLTLLPTFTYDYFLMHSDLISTT